VSNQTPSLIGTERGKAMKYAIMAIELGVYEQVRGPTPLDELSDDASP